MIEFCLLPYEEPFAYFSAFPEQAGTQFLDNASTHLGIGRYSYIVWNPFLEFVSKGDRYAWNSHTLQEKGDPLTAFFQKLENFPSESHHELPLFQGGAVGYLAYDFGACLERLPDLKPREHSFFDLHFFVYAHGLSFDTQEKKVWLFRQSFCPDSLEALKRQITAPKQSHLLLVPKTISVQSNFTREDYLKALEKTKAYLVAGDIFQANISQRFQGELPLPPRDLYARLRTVSPAPYAAYLDFGARQVLSSSPESFLQRVGRQIHTHPIKGTRKRGATPQEDEALKKELCESEKDRAELTMIIDLSRNDLGKVCEYGTVKVRALESGGMYLETHPTVYHLVSHVEGTLRPEVTNADILRACFPGGSITGAPKIRAMEIIEELEPNKRGVYTGSLGWIGFDASMQLSIGIRILQVEGERFSFQVGGGIVVDSIPEEEYQETLVKARGIFKALAVEKFDSSLL